MHVQELNDRVMDQHPIDIEAKVLPAPNIKERMTKGIYSLPPLPNEPCIFRVHEGLRHVNKDAYTPVLVSIGPYHHGKDPKFLPMEEHKRRYLKLLLTRLNHSIDPYLDAMTKLEHRAHNCYANPINIHGEDSFVEMMLLDGCFVVEFLRKSFLTALQYVSRDPIAKENAMEIMRQLQVDSDPIFKESWMATQIFSDLILVENQLPFFILSELFDMTSMPNLLFPPFEILASGFVTAMLPQAGDNSNNFDTSESKHFLDLMHNVCVPSSSREACPEESSSSSSNDEICNKMPCVMELEEAGVKFMGVVGVGDEISHNKVSMFDINFEHGVLKIPQFSVTDSTDSVFRNIIAYEQHCPVDEPKYFTDYTYFMNLLINTEADANKLRRHNIIDNMLGNDDEVAQVFNRMGDRIIICPNFYYSQLCKKINAHCDKSWNKAMANLRHNYFSNPWAGVSTIAATFLLLLAVIQTLVALIPLFA